MIWRTQARMSRYTWKLIAPYCPGRHPWLIVFAIVLGGFALCFGSTWGSQAWAHYANARPHAVWRGHWDGPDGQRWRLQIARYYNGATYSFSRIRISDPTGYLSRQLSTKWENVIQTNAFPEWVVTPSGSDTYIARSVNVRGWPIACFVGLIDVYELNGKGSAPGVVRVVPRGELVWGNMVANGHALELPYRPQVLRATANAATWIGMCLMCVVVYRTYLVWRAARRALNGLCAGCGYELGTTSVCPECGATNVMAECCR